MNRTEQTGTQDYQHMETLVNEVLRAAMRHVLADESLEVILSCLGQILKADRVYIFERNERGNDDNTYEWTRPGVTKEKDRLQDVPAEVCAKWYRNFSEGRITIIKDLEEIRGVAPLQYAKLKEQDITSIVTVPLFENKVPIGFYGVDNPPPELLEYTANLLQIAGYFVLALLRQRNLQRKLLHFSYHDQLTMTGNRHMFAETMEALADEEAVGFVYCDVTGLKRVNDTEGHQAGDRLLLNAVESLREAFPNDQLFRLGGDEFVVVCRSSGQAGQPDLQRHAARLRESAARRRVNLAIGHAWKRHPGNQLSALLSEAEQNMYNDKAEYYRRNGMDRRL